MARNIGINVAAPKDACDDQNCPFHGSVRVRGHTFVGTVTSGKMQNSSLVSWERKRLIPKYERYEKVKTKLPVHNPPCINAREGDMVKIMECRPLSKTKHFTIIEKLGHERVYELEKELGQEGKHKAKKKEEQNIAEAKAATEDKQSEEAIDASE